VFLQVAGTDFVYMDTRRRALSLLRCANTEAGLVNGLAMFAEDGDTRRQGICLANMNGINGRFISFSQPTSHCTDYAQTASRGTTF